MRRVFLLTLIVGISVVAGQSTEAAKNARIEGQVLSTAGGPVRNARLQLTGRAVQPGQPGATYSQTSDNEGKFIFAALPSGTYLLVTQKDGFSPAAAPGSLAPLSLSSGQVLKDLVVKLTPFGVITGHVTDQDGDPVASTQVVISRYIYAGGRKQLSRLNPAPGPSGPTISQTDELGNYRVANLPSGRYYISVNPIPPIALHVAERSGREVNVTTYYPSDVEAATAIPLDVAGGELRGIDIRVRKARVYSIRGKAVDTASRSAIVNNMLMLSVVSQADNSVNSMPLLPHADGTFELFNLIPGSYALQVRPPVGTENNFIGHSDVTIKDSDVDDVELRLTPAVPFEVIGSIKVEDGDLKQLASLLARSPLLQLREADTMNDAMLRPAMLSPEIKDDGTVRFQGVLPTKYLVVTPLQAAITALTGPSLRQGLYVKSVTLGGQDVTHAPLDFTSGAGGTLQIVLSAKAAAVNVTIRDSQGNANSTARVVLWPKLPDLGSPRGGVRFSSPTADPNGVSRINGLAPGDYYLAALEDLNLIDPNNVRLLTRDASSVKLGEGANETVELKLISKEKIAAAMATVP